MKNQGIKSSTKNQAWQVKGVTAETRTAVKHAARKSGKTIGEWVNETLHREAVADLTGQKNLPAKRLEDQFTEISKKIDKLNQPFWKRWLNG